MELKRGLMVLAGTALAVSSKCAEVSPAQSAAITAPALTLAPQPAGIWQGEMGEGFRSKVQTFHFLAGATDGFLALGGRERHDLALVSVAYGHMLGGVVGGGHWYRGNWELRGELFAGLQFSPSSTWLVGGTPHLRYNFATGTCWVPYVDGGAGVAATGIRVPDLGGAFEFNTQANIGLHWFVRDHLAVTFEAGYLHVSSAGIQNPNLGVNAVKGLAGVTWFF